MNWLWIAFIARFVEGSSATVDKKLLRDSYPNPWGYTFWAGVMEALVVVLVPFGFHFLAPGYTFVAITSGAAFILGAFFYFYALAGSEVSGTNVLLGALTPIATFFWSIPFLHIGLAGSQIVAFLLLIGASGFLFLSEKPELRAKIFFLIVVSGVFFGISSTLAKIVFMHGNFISGFVTIKIGGLLTVFSFLALPFARRHILSGVHAVQFKHKLIYILNRGYAGVGSVLVYYSISLGTPSLVDATAALRYVFVFLGAWLFLRENFRGKVLAFKIFALVLVSFGIIWLAVGQYLEKTAPNPNRPITWGITFSEQFSTMMGLDWKENYNAILSDLGVKHIRLIAYWDSIEKIKDQFDFTDLDYQMRQARKTGTDVVLTVGQRVPRWPECHFPDWTTNLTVGEKNQELLAFIKATVNQYKNDPSLRYWQVENEPFLNFGECPNVDPQFLDTEIQTAKSLDPAHKILVTDSGGLSLWYQAASRGDIFGTTIYRRTFSPHFGPLDYHLPPEFFRIKELFSRTMTHDFKKQYIVIELGAEPWLQHQLYETAITDQMKVFDLPYFKDTIGYAKAAGFDEYYLWGGEWWYWMKTKHDMPEFWDYAKTVFRPTP